jgi:hypothetical protein
MADDLSLDITGAGKLARAIPGKAWQELVHTACETFTKLLSPVTETTGGVGRLIQAKFDRLVDAEKVLAADVLVSASHKAQVARALPPDPIDPTTRGKKTKKEKVQRQVQAPVVITAIEEAGVQSDPTLRELWSNLLAQEITTGQVHPEFPAILKRLSAEEAILLARIAENTDNVSSRIMAYISGMNVSLGPVGASISAFVRGDHTFEHEHLRMLALIRKEGSVWFLTILGKAFVEAVSDPSIV